MDRSSKSFRRALATVAAVVVAAGTVVARGRHRELLDPRHPASAAYRTVVSRASEATVQEHGTATRGADSALDATPLDATTPHDGRTEGHHEAARR